MKHGKRFVALASLLAVAACSDDTGVNPGGPLPPQAAVRFVNLVVDTGAVDLRFVDRVENLPQLQGVGFRSYSGMFAPAEPGSRAARIFPSSATAGNLDLVTVRLFDQNVDLAVNTRHTLLFTGRAAANEQTLTILPEPAATALPSPGEGQIAVRVLHAALGVGNVDVHIAPAPLASDTVTPVPDPIADAIAVIHNVGYLGLSDGYITVPTRPSTGLSLYQFAVTEAGSTTPLFVARPNLPGEASSFPTVGPLPGVRISGSVLTAVVAPGSTPGTRQSTGANQSPTVFLMIDKTLDP